LIFDTQTLQGQTVGLRTPRRKDGVTHPQRQRMVWGLRTPSAKGVFNTFGILNQGGPWTMLKHVSLHLTVSATTRLGKDKIMSLKRVSTLSRRRMATITSVWVGLQGYPLAYEVQRGFMQALLCCLHKAKVNNKKNIMILVQNNQSS